MAEDETASWEGTVTQVKKMVDKALLDMKKKMNRNHNTMSTQVIAVASRLDSLDDKINDLQTRTPSMPDIERMFRRVLKESTDGEDEYETSFMQN